MKRVLSGLLFGLSISLATLNGITSHASLIFDPYLGYGAGQIKYKYADDLSSVSLRGTSDSGRADGFVYGARAGILFSDFLITAVEYQAITGTQKIKSTNHSDTFTQDTLYASIGYRTPLGIRFIGSYGFDTKIKATPGGGGENTNSDGTAYKILIGYLVPQFFSINAEYAIYNIKRIKQDGVTLERAQVFSSYDYSRMMITLSFPFRFF